MKLLIDISEYNAEYIKNAYGIPQDINMAIAEAIINGKQIPTPHGDLVDRTELLAEYDRQHKGPAGGARKIMEQATAIIKAED